MKRWGQKATREQTRFHNRCLIFKLIYDLGEISRADISRVTGLTRPTVSDIVSTLIEQGLVQETGHGPSAGGKPPILLAVMDDSRHLIGIDLASGEFRGAVVNLRGEIRHRAHRRLRELDGQEALLLVYDVLDELVAAASSPLLGIGIGSPGLMDSSRGIVRQAVNLDWQDLPLQSLLEERYSLPVYVANDCQVAALAEHTFGEDKDSDNLVLIKAEHGVGAGIVLNGQPFFGDTFGAGEIGHITIAGNVKRCRCGNYGCLETVASARAIEEQAKLIAQDDPQSLLHQFAPAPEAITIKEVCQAFKAGDVRVERLVKDVGRYLGIAVASIIGVFSSRRILIAGSIACFDRVLIASIQQEMVQRALAVIAQEVEIGVSTIGPDIVILGASALVLTYEMGLFAPPGD